ncbi:hypothetical protein ABZ557_20350, partial [Streptomyces sp. NPDC019645]
MSLDDASSRSGAGASRGLPHDPFVGVWSSDGTAGRIHRVANALQELVKSRLEQQGWSYGDVA